MKAMVVRAFGGPERITLEERERPSLGAGEALVRVAACGVCHHDVLDRKGLLPTARLPQVLGHEIAGTVETVGPGVETLAPGDPVAVYVRTSCGRCADCQAGRQDCCRHSRLRGSGADGGYAEYLLAAAHHLLPVPPSLSLVDAALAACPIGASLQALRQAAVGLGDVVLITGASGGLGLHQIALARLCGADVIAVTSSETKVEALRRAGASEVVLSPDLQFSARVWALTAKQGVSVALDNVVSTTLRESLRSLGQNGRLVVMGNVDVTPVPVDPGLLIGRRLRVMGSSVCTPRDLREAIDLLARGKVRPVIDAIYPFPEAAAAHRRLEERGALGRLVLAGW
jgi:D-arabinose 1-dehydrogenase-like Zn-dependent alcohol dehydrogenase